MKVAWFYLSALVAGLIIVLLPDTGPVVIQFNKDHGPSLQDLSGLIFVLLGWFGFAVRAWRRRTIIITRLGNQISWSIAGICLSAHVLIVVALAVRNDLLLAVSGTGALLPQLILMRAAFSRKDF